MGSVLCMLVLGSDPGDGCLLPGVNLVFLSCQERWPPLQGRSLMWAPYMVSPERGLGLFGLMIVSIYLEQDLQFWLHLDVLYVLSIVSFSRVLNFFIVRVGSFRLSGSLFHCLGRSWPVLLVSFFTTMLLGNRCGLFDGSFLKICLSLGGVRFFSVFIYSMNDWPREVYMSFLVFAL